MENNDSPYIYEKPLRSQLGQRSKSLAGFSALGLVGMVGIFGGSAIANTLVASSPATTANEANAVDLVEPPISYTDSLGETSVAAATVDSVSDPVPLVSIPLQEARPKPNSVKVELPALPDQAFGNTSSATPSVGSGNYSAGSAPVKYEARGERHEKYESHHDHDDHENESEDD